MKHTFTIILVLLLAGSAAAVKKEKKRPPQSQPSVVVVERERDELRLGWYLAPALKFGEIADDNETMVGIRGGLEFNRSFYIGLAGYGLPDDRYHDLIHERYFDEDEWALGYGGLEIGLMNANRNGSLAAGVLIGGGSVNIDENYFHDYEGFFVVEPQLDLNFNLSRHVRLGLGASYRFIDDLESIRYTEDDLDGPTFNVTLGFGRF